MKIQVFFKFPLFLLFSSKYLPCLARRGAEKVMTEMTSFMMTQGWECGMHCAEGWVIMIFIPGYHGRARVVCWCVQTAGVTFGESLPRPCTQCLRDDTMPQTRDQGVLCILDMCKF